MLAMLDRLVYASIVYNGVTGSRVCSRFIDLLLNTLLGILVIRRIVICCGLVIRRIVLLIVCGLVICGLVVCGLVIRRLIIDRIFLVIICRLILFGIIIGHLNNNAENYFVSHSSAVTIFARRPPSIIRR